VAVVLEAGRYPVRERAEVITGAVSGVAPARVTLNAAPESTTLRAEGWQLGALDLLRVQGTGFRLERGEREVRRAAPEIVVLIQNTGPGSVYTAHGSTQRLGHHDVILCDLTSSYDYAHLDTTGGATGVHVAYEDLALPIDAVRIAGPRLPHSPVTPLLRAHLAHLFGGIEGIAHDPAAARAVGTATIELTRAAVASVAGDPCARDVLHETLRTRIVAYVRHHLREPDLTVDRIAREHNIARRTLYNVWGDERGALTEWIVQQRLDGARRALSSGNPSATVAAVARHWGFADPTHFSRRFRAAYGVSPARYRTIAAEVRAPSDPSDPAVRSARPQRAGGMP
jgi:AraC-like DNA-binding protein